MTQSDPPAAPLYCVPCARKAAADYGNTGYPEQLPRFSPSPGGPVTGYRIGYRVPVAVAITGGDSVCLFHLLHPNAAHPD